MVINSGCGFRYGEENVNQIDSPSVETETTVPPETRRVACLRRECPCALVEGETEDQYVCANGEEETMEMVSAVH
jgi:hypothetical protein